MCKYYNYVHAHVTYQCYKKKTVSLNNLQGETF